MFFNSFFSLLLLFLHYFLMCLSCYSVSWHFNVLLITHYRFQRLLFHITFFVFGSFFFLFHFIISYIHLLLPFHSVEINGTTLSYILYRECILLRLFGRDYAGDTVVLGLQYIEKIQQQHTKKLYM